MELSVNGEADKPPPGYGPERSVCCTNTDFTGMLAVRVASLCSQKTTTGHLLPVLSPSWRVVNLEPGKQTTLSGFHDPSKTGITSSFVEKGNLSYVFRDTNDSIIKGFTDCQTSILNDETLATLKSFECRRFLHNKTTSSDRKWIILDKGCWESNSPNKRALLLNVCVHKMPSKDKKGNPFRQPYPNHYILPVIVDLQIHYRRNDNCKDMAAETLGYHSRQNMSPAALNSWPKYEVVDLLSFSTVFQMSKSMYQVHGYLCLF